MPSSTQNRVGEADAGLPSRAPTASWAPPAPSLAERRIPTGPKAGSVRGHTLTNGPERRRLAFESNGEAKTAHVLLARPDVVDLREQAEPVSYVDALGYPRKHYFDFVATLATGERVAIAYRPHVKARRQGLDGTLRLIAAQMGRQVADRVVHMSELDLPRDLVHDAKLLHAVRRDDRPEDDRKLAAIAATLQGVTTVGDLVRASGLAGRGFRAVVRLIGDGTLDIVGPRGIGYATQVVRGAKRAGGQ